MSETYCIYRNKRYLAEVKNSKIEITSNHRYEGFIEYVDVIGRTHDDLFIRKLDIDEVDVIYKEDVLIKYQDNYFELFADKIYKNNILDNSYMIWTNSEQLAQKYVFIKKEQFVFIKYITREEIEAVKIVKKPILVFKEKEPSEEILEGDDLDNWLSELI